MSIYKTISKDVQLEITPIKKSRFIGLAFYVENEQDILAKITESKTLYPSANHYCWAYSLVTNNQIRFNDDGEPSGSAGRPILSHIQGNDLVNLLIVVVRYFGGTKLGVGGLVRAYGQAAKEVLSMAEIINVVSQCSIYIEYDYTQTNIVDTLLKRYNAIILTQEYAGLVTLTININISDKTRFIDELINVTKASVSFKLLDQS